MSALLWFLLFGAALMTAVLALLMLHLPVTLQRGLVLVPEWAIALFVHFGYGLFLGGTTGHLLAAFVSIPLYFVHRHFVRPRMRQRIEDQNVRIKDRVRGWFGAEPSAQAPA